LIGLKKKQSLNGVSPEQKKGPDGRAKENFQGLPNLGEKRVGEYQTGWGLKKGA